MSFISSFEVIKVVVPKPSIFFCIPASAADAAAITPNRIKTLLANGLITFFVNGNPVFNNGPRSLYQFYISLYQFTYCFQLHFLA